MRPILAVLLALAGLCAAARPQDNGGKLTMRDIVPEDAEVRKVATGFTFTEGPSWDWRNGRLLFSDIPASKVNALAPDGAVSVFLDPSQKSNGTFWDPRDGSLVMCRHWARDVARVSADGRNVTVLADSYNGKKLNSPNDCVILPSGVIYFTDPHYGLEGRPQEQPLEGVYKLDPHGALTLVVDDMTRPNGLEVSPDGKTLYVADSQESIIRTYPLKDDGTCGEGRLFAELKAPEPGVPDGMTLDVSGNVLTTGPGGIWIYTPAGKKLGRIDTPEVPSNCTFGGRDGKTLYITAVTSVYAIDLSVKGWFPLGIWK